MGHTPGEWKAVPEHLVKHKGRETRVAGNSPSVVTKDGRAIAKVNRRTDYVAGQGYPKGRDNEAEANARLIAAAPDLLEALSNLLNCVDGQHSNEWLNRCKAASIDAINKAKGE